jgi:tRNA-dihydrouridine synthase B
VHGRTRMQFYEGRADWTKIAAVRAAISIPLIANGDVETEADLERILEQSGADGVMLGRGSQGRPWHAGVLAGMRTAPERAEIAAIFERHYRMTLDFYGGIPGLRHARKHVGWTLDRFGGGISPDLRKTIMTSHDPEAVIDIMHAILLNPAATAPTLENAA